MMEGQMKRDFDLTGDDIPESGSFINGNEYTNFLNRLIEKAEKVSYQRYTNRGTGETEDQLCFWNTEIGGRITVNADYEITNAHWNENIFKTIKGYKKEDRMIWL